MPLRNQYSLTTPKLQSFQQYEQLWTVFWRCGTSQNTRLISVSAYGWAGQSCQFYLCAELLHFQNCSMHKKSMSSLSGPRSDLHSCTIAFKGLVCLVVLMCSHLPFHSVYFCFGRTCGCRDQLSQEEGVVDKMQVFRPDRVFMV